MAKRNTGLSAKRRKKSSPHKTKKRLAIKYKMLAARRSKLAKRTGKKRK